MGISTNKCKTFAQQMDGWKFQYKTKLEKKKYKKGKNVPERLSRAKSKAELADAHMCEQKPRIN